MSFIPFNCSFCAACIPIRSWYSFKIHLKTKRHCRKSLGDKHYLDKYLEHFIVDRRKFDDMTDHLSIEKTGELMHKFQTKLLEIVTEVYTEAKNATPREVLDSYCLRCLACSKEFTTFNDGMVHRTSQRHIDNCRDLGCEEFKLTFPLVESESSGAEEEEVAYRKVLKLKPKTPSPKGPANASPVKVSVAVNVPYALEC